MVVYFLKDIAEDCVDAVIIAETSTREDIVEAIERAKQKENYQWEDLVNELPDDCTIYDIWGSEIVYY